MNNVESEIVRPKTIIKESEAKLKRPPMYRVILLNDDYTPMDFVVEVLQRYFLVSKERATVMMWQVHTRGMAVCGIYSRDVAETKVEQVNQYAKVNEYPLLCEMATD